MTTLAVEADLNARQLLATSEYVPTDGKFVEPFTPGDILLIDDYSGAGDLVGNLVRAGERARYGNSDYARWTHSALIVSEEGDIVEALREGVRRTNIVKYTSQNKLIITPTIPVEDPRRAYAVRFVLGAVGDNYGILNFIGLALSLLTRLDFSIQLNKDLICSGEVTRGTESYTLTGYPEPPQAMMPGDIAYYFDAKTPLTLPPISLTGHVLDTFKAIMWWISPFHSGIRPLKAEKQAS